MKENKGKKVNIPCNELGITLISLVVTIIVLIILAGITIGNVINHNLINRSEKGADKYVNEGEREQEIFSKIENIIEKNQLGIKDEEMDADVHLPKNKKVVEVGTNKAISEIVGNNKVNVMYNGNKITNTKQLPVDKYYLIYNKKTNTVEVETEISEVPDSFEGTELYVIGEEYNDDIPDISSKEHTLYQRSGAKIQKDEDGYYYLNFDGTDDYAQIAELEENINFIDGFEIEFLAEWKGFNHHSRILDFGNGAPGDNIIVANYKLSSNLFLDLYDASNAVHAEPIISTQGPILKQTQKYNIKYVKNNEGTYDIIIYKNNKEINRITTTITLRNILRTLNYLGKSNWAGESYFNGKIYNLKITQADGMVVLHYDINKMLNKKMGNIEIAKGENELVAFLNKYYPDSSTSERDIELIDYNVDYINTNNSKIEIKKPGEYTAYASIGRSCAYGWGTGGKLRVDEKIIRNEENTGDNIVWACPDNGDISGTRKYTFTIDKPTTVRYSLYTDNASYGGTNCASLTIVKNKGSVAFFNEKYTNSTYDERKVPVVDYNSDYAELNGTTLTIKEPGEYTAYVDVSRSRKEGYTTYGRLRLNEGIVFDKENRNFFVAAGSNTGYLSGTCKYTFSVYPNKPITVDYTTYQDDPQGVGVNSASLIIVKNS